MNVEKCNNFSQSKNAFPKPGLAVPVFHEFVPTSFAFFWQCRETVFPSRQQEEGKTAAVPEFDGRGRRCESSATYLAIDLPFRAERLAAELAAQPSEPPEKKGKQVEFEDGPGRRKSIAVLYGRRTLRIVLGKGKGSLRSNAWTSAFASAVRRKR
jgi:hypothetical protein